MNDELRILVKELREEKKIGSRQLSRRIGKAETYISQFERGQIKNPEYQVAFNILLHLGKEEDETIEILKKHYEVNQRIRKQAKIRIDDKYGDNKSFTFNVGYSEVKVTLELSPRKDAERLGFIAHNLKSYHVSERDIVIDTIHELLIENINAMHTKIAEKAKKKVEEGYSEIEVIDE